MLQPEVGPRQQPWPATRVPSLYQPSLYWYANQEMRFSSSANELYCKFFPNVDYAFGETLTVRTLMLKGPYSAPSVLFGRILFAVGRTTAHPRLPGRLFSIEDTIEIILIVIPRLQTTLRSIERHTLELQDKSPVIVHFFKDRQLERRSTCQWPQEELSYLVSGAMFILKFGDDSQNGNTP